MRSVLPVSNYMVFARSSGNTSDISGDYHCLYMHLQLQTSKVYIQKASLHLI